MRYYLLAALLLTLLACKKEDEPTATPTPAQRQVELRAHCFECIVDWSTSTGASGNFHLIGDTAFTTTVPAGGTYTATGCAPPAFSIPPPFDTLAAIWSSVDGTELDFHHTVWIDSCAAVGGVVP